MAGHPAYADCQRNRCGIKGRAETQRAQRMRKCSGLVPEARVFGFQ